MRDPHDVILQPVITEQSMMDASMGKYTFIVAKDAGKTEIKQACEKLFEVKVTAVNTIKLRGKFRRMGRNTGYTAERKKAIVTIDLDPQPQSYALSGGKVGSSTKKYKTQIEEFGFGQ